MNIIIMPTDYSIDHRVRAFKGWKLVVIQGGHSTEKKPTRRGHAPLRAHIWWFYKADTAQKPPLRGHAPLKAGSW